MKKNDKEKRIEYLKENREVLNAKANKKIKYNMILLALSIIVLIIAESNTFNLISLNVKVGALSLVWPTIPTILTLVKLAIDNEKYGKEINEIDAEIEELSRAEIIDITDYEAFKMEKSEELVPENNIESKKQELIKLRDLVEPSEEDDEKKEKFVLGTGLSKKLKIKTSSNLINKSKE